ncbi:MAG: hypothetical protein HYY51_01220 [Candidatus Magasanikbacteria bacterium]|nr:hypothetical protein [Candidatus Magasanikbacteria bacterium]
MADKTTRDDPAGSEHSVSRELQKLGGTAQEKLRYIELLRAANTELIKREQGLADRVTDLQTQLTEMRGRAAKGGEGADQTALDDIRDELALLLAGITGLARDIENAGGRIHDLEETAQEPGPADAGAAEGSSAAEAPSTEEPGPDIETDKLESLKAQLKADNDAQADRLDALLKKYEKILRINRNLENRRTDIASKDWVSVADSVEKMKSAGEAEALRGRIRTLKEKIDALERDIIAQAAHDASAEELGNLFIGAMFGSSVEEMAESSSDAHFVETKTIKGQSIDYNTESGVLSSSNDPELRVNLRAGKSVPEVLTAEDSSKGPARIKGFAYGQLKGAPRLAYFEDGSVTVWAYEGESGTEKTKVFAKRAGDNTDIQKIFDLIQEAVDFIAEHYAADRSKKKAAEGEDDGGEKTELKRSGAFVFDAENAVAKLQRGKGKETDISVKGEKPFVHVEDDGSFSFSYPHLAGSPRLRLRVFTSKGGEPRRRLECYTTEAGADEGEAFFSKSHLDKEQDVFSAIKDAISAITSKVDEISASEGEARAGGSAPVFDAGGFQRDDFVVWTSPSGETGHYQIVSGIESGSAEVTLRSKSDDREVVVSGKEMKTMRLAEAEEGESSHKEKKKEEAEVARRPLDTIWAGQTYHLKTKEFRRGRLEDVEYDVKVENVNTSSRTVRVSYMDAKGETASLVLNEERWSSPEYLTGPKPGSPDRPADVIHVDFTARGRAAGPAADPTTSRERMRESELKRACSDLKVIIESSADPERRRKDLSKFHGEHKELIDADRTFKQTFQFAFDVSDLLTKETEEDGSGVLWVDKQAEAKRMLAGDERARIDNDAIKASLERLWWIVRNEVDTEKIRAAIQRNTLLRGLKAREDIFGDLRGDLALEVESSKESKIDNWLKLAHRREDIVRTTAGYLARETVALEYAECADAQTIVSTLTGGGLPQRLVDASITQEEIVPRLHAMMEGSAFPIERVAGLAQGQEFALAYKKGRGDREHLETSVRGILADLDFGVGTRACKLTEEIRLPPKKGSGDSTEEGTVLRDGYLYKIGIRKIEVNPGGEIVVTTDKINKKTGEFRTCMLRFGDGLADLAAGEDRDYLSPAETAEALAVFQRAAENNVSYERNGKTVTVLNVETGPGLIVLEVYDVNSGTFITLRMSDKKKILERKAAIEAAEAARQPELSAEQIRETYDIFKIESDLDIMGPGRRVKGSFKKAGTDDYQDPESHFEEAKLLAFGDMHGSALKVLESVILSKAASMPPEAAREFGDLYADMVEAARPVVLATADAPNEHSPFETAEKKEEFKKKQDQALVLLDTLQWIAGEGKQLVFIGDMVSDRGLSDALTFKILSKLRANLDSDIRVLASNHDLNVLFNWSGLGGIDTSGAEDEQISMFRATSLLDDKAEFQLRYMDHVRSLSLIEYDRASGVFFAHGPIVETQVQKLKSAVAFTEDLSADNMPDFVAAVNAWYKKAVESVLRKEPDETAIRLINEIAWERHETTNYTSGGVPLPGIAKHVVHGHTDDNSQKEVSGVTIHNINADHRKVSGDPMRELSSDGSTYSEAACFILRADETDLTEEYIPEMEISDAGLALAGDRAGEDEEADEVPDPEALAEEQRSALFGAFSEICVPGGVKKLRRGKDGYLEYNSGTDTEEKWSALNVDLVVFENSRLIEVAERFSINEKRRRDFFSAPWALWLAENGLEYKPEARKKKKTDDSTKSPEERTEEQKAALFLVLSENFAPGAVLRRNYRDNYLDINTPDAEGEDSWSQLNAQVQIFEHPNVRRVMSEQGIDKFQFWFLWKEWLGSVGLEVKAREPKAKAEAKKEISGELKAQLFDIFARVFPPGKKIKRDEENELRIRLLRVAGGKSGWVRLQANAHVMAQRNVKDFIDANGITETDFYTLWREWLDSVGLSVGAKSKDSGADDARATAEDAVSPEERRRAAAFAWFEEEILRKADLSLGSDGSTLMRKREKETKYSPFNPEKFKHWFKGMKRRPAGLRADMSSGELDTLFDEWFSDLDRSTLKKLTKDQEAEIGAGPDRVSDKEREARIRADAFSWFENGLLPELALGHDGTSVVRKRADWEDYRKFNSEKYKEGLLRMVKKPSGLTSDIHATELSGFFDEWYAALDKDTLPKLADIKEPSNLTEEMQAAIVEWFYSDNGIIHQLSRKKDGTIMRRRMDNTVEPFKPEGFIGWLLRVKKPIIGLVGTPGETANGAACVTVFDAWWSTLDLAALPDYEAKPGDHIAADEADTTATEEAGGTTVAADEEDTAPDTEIEEGVRILKRIERGRGRFRLEFSNGDVYEGGLDAENRPHGKGIYLKPDGIMHQGTFVHGLKHGKFALRRMEGDLEVLGYEDWENGVPKELLDISTVAEGEDTDRGETAEPAGESKEYKAHGRKEILPGDLIELIGPDKLKHLLELFVSSDEQSVQTAFHVVFDDAGEEDSRFFEALWNKGAFKTIADFRDWWKGEAHEKLFRALQFELYAQIEREVAADPALRRVEEHKSGWRSFFDGVKDFGARIVGGAAGGAGAMAAIGGISALKSVAGAAALMSGPAGLAVAGVAALTGIVASRIVRRNALRGHEERKLSGKRGKEVEAARLKAIEGVFDRLKNPKKHNRADDRDEIVASHLSATLNELIDAQIDGRDSLGAEALHVRAACILDRQAQARAMGRDSTEQEQIDARGKRAEHLIAALDFRNNRRRENRLLQTKSARVAGNLTLMQELRHEIGRGNISNLWIDDPSRAKRWTGTAVEGVVAASTLMAVTAGGAAGALTGFKKLGLGLFRFGFGYARGRMERGAQLKAEDIEVNKKRMVQEARKLLVSARKRLREAQQDPSKISAVSGDINRLIGFFVFDEANPLDRIFAGNEQLRDEISLFLKEAKAEQKMHMLSEDIQRGNELRVREWEDSKLKEVRSDKQRAAIANRAALMRGAITAGLGAAFDWGMSWVKGRFLGGAETEKTVEETPRPKAERQVAEQEPATRPREAIETEIPGVDKPLFDYNHPTDPALAAKLEALKAANPEAYHRFGEMVGGMWTLDEKEVSQLLDLADIRKGEGVEHRLIAQLKFLDRTLEGEDREVFNQLIRYKPGSRVNMETLIEREAHRIALREGYAGANRVVRYPLWRHDVNQLYVLGADGEKFSMEYAQEGGDHVLEGSRFRPLREAPEPAGEPRAEAPPEPAATKDAVPQVDGPEAVSEQELVFAKEFTDQINASVGPEHELRLNPDLIQYARPGAFSGSPVASARLASGGGGVEIRFEDGTAQVFKPVLNHPTETVVLRPVSPSHVEAPGSSGGGGPAPAEPRGAPARPSTEKGEVTRFSGKAVVEPGSAATHDMSDQVPPTRLESVERAIETLPFNPEDKATLHNYALHMDWQERMFADGSKSLATMVHDAGFADPANQRVSGWIGNTSVDILTRLASARKAFEDAIAADRPFHQVMAEVQKHHMFTGDDVAALPVQVDDTPANFAAYKGLVLDKLKGDYRSTVEPQIDLDAVSDPRLGSK